ncbi:MAG: hypothetical protein RR428_06515, partial [Coprobacillus sp.]
KIESKKCIFGHMKIIFSKNLVKYLIFSKNLAIMYKNFSFIVDFNVSAWYSEIVEKLQHYKFI